MKIAFPVKEKNGLESILDDHFGVAEHFLIVDLENRGVQKKGSRQCGGYPMHGGWIPEESYVVRYKSVSSPKRYCSGKY